MNFKEWRRGAFIAALLLWVLCFTAGCQPGMARQPKYKPLAWSPLFSDQTSARPLPPGTVAQGHLDADDFFYRATEGGHPATHFPVPVSLELVHRGQQRFEIFCAVCHGRDGAGHGLVVSRGFPAPPTFHSARLRAAPLGHLFDVISNGYGAMYSYGDRIAVKDRWAVIAYIRALQLSQNGKLKDLTAVQRANLLKQGEPAHD